jgi:hypothetical protein
MSRRNGLNPPRKSGHSVSISYPPLLFPVPDEPIGQLLVMLPDGRSVAPEGVPDEFKAQLAEEERWRAEDLRQWLSEQK